MQSSILDYFSWYHGEIARIKIEYNDSRQTPKDFEKCSNELFQLNNQHIELMNQFRNELINLSEKYPDCSKLLNDLERDLGRLNSEMQVKQDLFIDASGLQSRLN